MVRKVPAWAGVKPKRTWKKSLPLSRKGMKSASVSMQMMMTIQKVPGILAMSLSLISSTSLCSSCACSSSSSSSSCDSGCFSI